MTPRPGSPAPQDRATGASTAPLIRAENLQVSFPRNGGVARAAGDADTETAGRGPAVRGLTVEVWPGECVALVGESGSGKSVTARALVGLAGPQARVSADRWDVLGQDARHWTARRWRSVRGSAIGFVLQDAMQSLDPLRPIGREVGDAVRIHARSGRFRRSERDQDAAVAALAAAGMPEPEAQLDRLSGELSGGMRQRALIAAAISARPQLLIADEPTTALDAAVAARVIAQFRHLRDSGMGVLFISHDLSAVRSIADRILVMHAGAIVEAGPAERILTAAEHPYTRALLEADPAGVPRGTRLIPAGSGPALLRGRDSAEEPPTSGGTDVVLEARGVSLRYPQAARPSLEEVSVTLRAGRTLGLVGGSGSGKTSLARVLLGLQEPDAGHVALLGEPWSNLPERRRRARRTAISAVFQDSLGTLDPRWTVRRTLLDALHHRQPPGAGATGGVHHDLDELLDQLALPASLLNRRPGELSGGERQRVSIARAVATRPRVLVCDEPVSALDVQVQARILDLLDDIQARLATAIVFISHDLAVVAHMSDDVAVMDAGRIVETGPAGRVLEHPTHPYTRELVDAVRTVAR